MYIRVKTCANENVRDQSQQTTAIIRAPTMCVGGCVNLKKSERNSSPIALARPNERDAKRQKKLNQPELYLSSVFLKGARKCLLYQTCHLIFYA